MKRLLIAILILFWGIATSLLGAERVGVINVQGAIVPATAEYISRAIKVSVQEGYECLVVLLDTPGGLLETTKVIIQQFLASPVPVVVYVYPQGANAASAGCFITLAADVAAMAPTTSIGAAHPVPMGLPGGGEKMDDAMKQKLSNFAASYIEAIAARRKRNVEWARASVAESAAISAEKALEIHVIDLIANDLKDLLVQLDGREVRPGKILKTANAEIIQIPMSLRERLFQLMRPEVMFILILIAIYGIIAELNHPGAIFPGVIGTIALILALYMASVLPVNVAGAVLILLGVGMLIAEFFVVSHGLLTVGGAITFFLGALMLFDRSDPFLRLSLSIIIPATVVTVLFFLFVVGAGLKAQLLPVKTGREAMIGQTTRALTKIDRDGGKVFIEGEYWNAVSDEAIQEGETVEIIAIEGLTLKVRPKKESR
jgi:membrane-bound serine protease (ClpP class)